MSTKLPNNALEERLRWVLPIVREDIRLVDAAKVFPSGKRTLERWLANYKKEGEDGLIPKSTRPKTQPNETPIRIKEKIIDLRKETRLCAKKLNYKLKKEHIKVSDRLIGKVIKSEGLNRKYRVRKLKYKYVKVPLAKGDLVEMDIKYVPSLIGQKRYYQYTAIDCASRWRYLEIFDCDGNSETLKFVSRVLEIAPFRIRAIKTDNGSCFTNRYTGYKKSSDPINPKLHELDLFCQKHNIIHYLIDPGKPVQNGKVERSHRTDQEMFYDRRKFKTVLGLKRAVKQWNITYNNLEHCALEGRTPNEMLLIN
ncbi:MAG TPA: IS481 family transposase [bacterium]|jgi:transposase InsO family protein|nr:IS481 family transposase [bacterium]HPW39199.1 IS481 family transposase [bacterium]